METPEFIKMPKSLKEIIKKENHRIEYAAHEELKDGKVYIYTFLRSHGEWEPDTITVMNKEGWRTWNGKKWGKSMINGTYHGTLHYDRNIDKEVFGETIEDLQLRKTNERQKREQQKKEAIIQQIVSRMKKIPKRLQKWMYANIKHYILFESGKRDGFCTDCAAHVTFTGSDRPKNGRYIKCPSCGKIYEARTYKTVPKYTSRPFFWIQKCKDGYLLRIMNLERRNPKDPDITPTEDTYEVLCGSVINGEQHWIEKRCFWDYWFPESREHWFLNRTNGATRNYLSPYYGTWSREYRRIREKNEEEAKLLYEPLTYNDIDECIRESESNLKYIIPYMYRHVSSWDGWDFMEADARASECPQIEGLYKNGFMLLAEDILNDNVYYRFAYDKKQTELHKFLQISKETFRILLACDHKADLSWKELMTVKKLEKTDAKREKYIGYLAHSVLDTDEVIGIAENLNIRFTKLHRYLAGQKKNVRYGAGVLYKDYIKMCKDNEMDLQSEFNLFPKNLTEAHDSLVFIKEERERKEYEDRMMKKNDAFRKALGKRAKKFTLENDDLFIRPAMSASEIVKEGQNQHNCVGRAGYIEKMIDHRCMILFLRKKEDPDTSYYTVETDMKGNLRQAFAAFNSKTEDYDTNIKPLLDQLRKKVQGGKKHTAAG